MANAGLVLGSDLPIEIENNQGVNRAPLGIISCIVIPEVFAIAGYLLLTWQLLAVCVDSQPKQ